MFKLSKSFTFEAAHKLPSHDGKCARLHGHSWKGTVVLHGHFLDKYGPKKDMLYDYGEISKTIKPIIDEYLDHHYLNDSLELVNPTSEKVAEWLYIKLNHMFDGLLKAVIIEETCTSSCEYSE